jgi:hypothetical protein
LLVTKLRRVSGKQSATIAQRYYGDKTFGVGSLDKVVIEPRFSLISLSYKV